MSTYRIVALILAGWCTAGIAQRADSPKLTGSDWPQFRGPGGAGVSAGKGLPTTWSATESITWKTPLPGHGASSPIVVGNRVFVTCFSGFGLDADNPGEKGDLRLHVVCVDLRNGKIAWEKNPNARGLPKYGSFGKFTALHGFASSTPASDGKAVYTFFGNTGVVAFDMSGERLWAADVGTKTHGFGTGASPILYGDLLIVNASVESRSLIALNKQTGAEVWRAEGIKDAWDTPVLVAVAGGTQELVVDTKDGLRAFDPRNGQSLWHCPGSKPPRYICPSPVSNNGIVYALHGYFGPFTAIRAGGRGNAGTSHQVWQLTDKRLGSNVPSPVWYAGNIYWTKSERGNVFCIDAETGELQYRSQLTPRPHRIYASPLVADGKLYYVSRKQGTYVLAAKPTFELLAHNTIATDSSAFNASPAVTEGRLLLRSDRFLYCIGMKQLD